MLRTERGKLRRGFDDFLLEVLRSAVCAASLSLLLALLSLQDVMAPILGALVFVAGIAYGSCALLRRPPPHGTPKSSRRLETSEKRLAVSWVLAGLLLVLLGKVVQLTPLVALLGVGVCLMLHRRGHVLEVRWSRLPNRSWRWRSPLLKAFLAFPFLLISYTGFAYAGLEGVEIYRDALMSGDSVEAEDPPSESAGHLGAEHRFSYAELCKDLPDPQQIGYGLGDLFEHDGAVAAGCGEPAMRIGDSTWVSPGLCGTDLRSLAVVGEGREPVLLYGAPSRLAWAEAQTRDLRFAEAAEMAGGEVALVEGAGGTVAFTRPSPALRPGEQDARRCQEVDEVARPFTELEPPLAQLWFEYMAMKNEWIWPETDEEGDDVIFRAADGLPAYGSCEGELGCRLDGPGLHLFAEESATISLNQLNLYGSTAAVE